MVLKVIEQILSGHQYTTLMTLRKRVKSLDTETLQQNQIKVLQIILINLQEIFGESCRVSNAIMCNKIQISLASPFPRRTEFIPA